MAKSVTLTVNVDDAQFQAFVKNYTNFSNQIKSLNTQFTQLSGTVQKLNAHTSNSLNMMKALGTLTTTVLGGFANITKHLVRWGTIIGGIGAMLGMGAGLFGIDRLANSILAKRRMVLGLGGDYGRTQAATIFGRGFLDNPQGILENIAAGKGGSSEQLRSLLSLGVPFGTTKKPEELLPQIIESLHDKMRQAGPGLGLRVGQMFGGALGFSNQDLLRIQNMSRDERQAFAKKIAEQGKEMDLSKKAQKGWEELALQFKAAATAIETTFGEKLADMAEPIKKVSEGFVNLVKALMQAPIVERVLKKVAEWLNKFADYLKSDDLKKDLEKFSGEVEKWTPVLREVKDALLSFADTLSKITSVLGPIFHFLRSTPSQLLQEWRKGEGPLFGPGAPLGGTAQPKIQQYPPGVRSRQPGSFMGPPAVTPPATTTPTPQSLPPPAIPLAPQGASIGGSTQFASAISRGGDNFTSSMSRGSSMTGFMGGPGGAQFNQQFAAAGGGGGVLWGGGAGDRSNGSRMAAWASAASSRVPTPAEQGSALGRSTFAGLTGFGPGGGPSRGPLDIDNWQSTRTASLTLRNVPGSSVFSSANGMG